MYKVTSHIIIKGNQTWTFDYLNDCEIVEDVTSLTDTCVLILPKKIKWANDTVNDGKPPIKRGDKIEVYLGYDDKNKLRFSGYVRSVNANRPITIKCEDGMFLLKQKSVTPKAYRKAMLDDVVGDLMKGTGTDYQLVENIALGNYRTTRNTVAEELLELKEKHLLNSYFRIIEGKNILYIGLQYPIDGRKKVVFKHGKNIISEDLEYRNKEDIRAKVQASSMDDKRKITKIEIGDKDGEIIKIRVDGLSESELIKYAEEALQRYKITGFKGSFKTFGNPIVRKCDIVNVAASDGNSGSYLVKKNTIKSGINGYRQDIELGQALQ